MRLFVIAALGLFAISLALDSSTSEPTTKSTDGTSTATDPDAGTSKSTASTGSSDDASSTTAGSGSTVTGESSTSAPSTPANTGSTATPGSTTTGPSTPSGPTTTSGSPGPSASTVTHVSGSTATAEPAASTSSPVPLSTTPYPVTVLKKGIDMSCSAGRCKYVLKVPVLSKGFLDTQQGLIDQDRKQLATDETKLATIEQKNGFEGLQEQFNELKKGVDGALVDLAKLKAALARMKDNNAKIKNSITDAQRIIGFFSNDQDNCLYKECLIPQSTTIVTTTPEPPSSTVDPCTEGYCNDYATCSNQNGQPTCGPCLGNLASEQQCLTSVCTPVGQSVPQLLNSTAGFFLSPGWTIHGNGTTYKTTKCEWKFKRGPGTTISIVGNDTLPLSTMDPDAILSFDNGASVNTANRNMKLQKLQNALNTNPQNDLTITFSPGACTGGDTCYFSLQLTIA